MTIDGQSCGCGTSRDTIPLNENTVERLAEILMNEEVVDLVWGPVDDLSDNVPIWVTNEYLVSKEVMENYASKLKEINNIEVGA